MADLIHSEDVTLLGELDLDASSGYAGLDWSVRDLAEFACQTKPVTDGVESAKGGHFAYPAVLAVWAVAAAQDLEDGDMLWKASHFDPKRLNRIGAIFRQSIQVLGLEDFGDRLESMQQYVALARMHAIIPTYALSKFVDHIRQAVTRHQHHTLAYQDLLRAQDLAKPLRKLLAEKPDLGIDLVSRALQTLQLGTDCGLPPRITQALLRTGSMRSNRLASRTELPAIYLDQSQLQLYVVGAQGWRLRTERGTEPDFDNLECCAVFASRDQGPSYSILSVDEGYLIFGPDGRLVDSRTIPGAGALLMWSEQVRVAEDALASDPDPLFGTWTGWKAALIRTDRLVELQMPGNVRRVLGVRKALEIQKSQTPWLETLDSASVFGAAPVLVSGRGTTVIDMRTGTRHIAHPGDALIAPGLYGDIDLSVQAMLGRTEAVRGYLAPGLEVQGDLGPMLLDDQRSISIATGPGWVAPNELTVVGGARPLQTFDLTPPDGNPVQIQVNPKLVNWSLVFTDEVPTQLFSVGKFERSRFNTCRSLVLHELNEIGAPTLVIRDGESAPRYASGSIRGQDVIFDLRPFNGAHSNQPIRITTKLRGRDVELALFLPPQKRREFTRSVTDLRDLGAAAVDAGIMTADELSQFARERAAEARWLRRYGRVRRENS